MNIDSMKGNLYENMLINGIVEMVATFVPIFILTKYGRIHSQFTWLSLIVVPSIFGLFLEDSEYRVITYKLNTLHTRFFIENVDRFLKMIGRFDKEDCEINLRH